MTWPAVASVLPQKPPMVLLDEIVAHDATSTTCRVRIRRGAPFADERGDVPSYVALEYMAQTAAAHSGLASRAQGTPIRLGFLLGSRRIELHVERFLAGQELDIVARQVWSDGELGSFACTVRDVAGSATLAECVLNALSPRDPDHAVAGLPA